MEDLTFVQVGDHYVNAGLIEAFREVGKHGELRLVVTMKSGRAYVDRESTVEKFTERLLETIEGEASRWYCGHLNPNPAYPYLCTKDEGHEGQHGYAGVFWDGLAVP